jgi:outer membrane protein assembly factor BamB
MKSNFFFSLTVIAVAFVACGTLATVAQADDWSSFLGPGATSNTTAVLPKEIDDEKNVQWKTKLPGKGASGPITVGDKVFVTCSGGGDRQNELFVVCVDSKTGDQIWQQQFWATGRCFVHPLSANAAPTPVSDGDRIYAFFSSNDLACLDLDGNLLWYRGLAVDFPKAGNDVGMASSPAVKDGVVVVQVECQGDSFAMGLDASNGTTMWKQDRSKDASWATPTIVSTNSGKQLVAMQSSSKFDVLDLKTGDEVFSAEGDCSTISTSSLVGNQLLVPLDGTTVFDVSSDGAISKKWQSAQLKAGSPSYQVTDESIYTCNSKGILTTYSRETGEQTNKARIDGSYWATPVIADGHMYCFGQDGFVRIVELGGEAPKVVHKYQFEDEVFLGSPAVSGNAMFVRSNNYLWKFAE